VVEPVKVSGNEITFKDGKNHQFDAIVFAIGYKSTFDTHTHTHTC